MINFTITGEPRTKKNSQRIVYKYVKNKKRIPFIIPSKAYEQYKKDCGWLIPSKLKNLDLKSTYNIKCTYYMKTNGKVDLTNLLNATMDILVDYNVLSDDNSKVAHSNDGSRVKKDSNNPRVEIEIVDKLDRDDFIHYKKELIKKLENQLLNL